MQAVAVRAASRRPPGGGPAGTALGSVDPGLVVRMLRQWRFVASLGLDLIGFLAQLVALRRLPLFAVQAMVAGSLAVTAVLAAWLINVQLAWREWLAVAGVVVGVGLLGASAGAEGAKAVGGPFKLALIVAVAAVAVAGVLAARLPPPARTPLLGARAGVVAVAARTLPGYSLAELARDPAAYAAVAGGVVSFMLYAAALDNGSVTVATAAVVLAETAPPALVGILFLGDHTRPGLAPVAWVAFVLAVTCAVLLARFGEAGENAGGGPQTARRGPRGGLTPDQDGEPSTSTVL